MDESRAKIWNVARMNLFPSHIILNGHRRTINEVLQDAAFESPYQKAFIAFLSEWYNGNDSINVKTSGSTGTPKLISLKKDFVAASAARTIHFFNLEEGDRVLHCLPTSFIAGKLMVVRALLGKLDLHLVDPSSDFSILQTQRFKFAAMVINQVEKLLLNGSCQNLQYLLIGGSAVPPTLEQKLQAVDTLCYSSYAMTETATHIALRQLNGKERSAAYHCLDGISVTLNAQKCICIQMPGLKNTCIETNDLGELQNTKTFKVLGRADNMIVSGGIKFSPETLEAKLAPHINVPFVISAKPDNHLGEKIVLVLESPENEALKTSVEALCKNILTKYERPREIVFTDRLPRTENGKIKRLKLRNKE